METATRQPSQPAVPPPVAQVRRTSSSRFCAFDLGDAELRDVVLGSLSPILVAFVERHDPRWESTTALLESVASDRVRAVLGDPVRCRTSAELLGYAGALELLLIGHGCLVRRIDVSTPPGGIVQLAHDS